MIGLICFGLASEDRQLRRDMPGLTLEGMKKTWSSANPSSLSRRFNGFNDHGNHRGENARSKEQQALDAVLFPVRSSSFMWLIFLRDKNAPIFCAKEVEDFGSCCKINSIGPNEPQRFSQQKQKP